MADQVRMEYTRQERLGLGVLATFGLVGVNGVFFYAALFEPGTVRATLENPLAAAFVAEALVLAGALAYLLARWKVSRVHWIWFVVLSLAGSIAFALPVVLLVSSRRAGPGQETSSRT